MSRALPALLLLALLLPAGLAAAQEPGRVPALGIPTQVDFEVGGLNVTTWVMHDPTSIAYAVTPGDVQGSLQSLWNTNFTAGSLGILYVKATVREEGNYTLRATVAPGSTLLQVAPPDALGYQRPAKGCSADNLTIVCELDNVTTQGDYTFRWFTGIGTPPGSFNLTLQAETYLKGPEGPQLQARGEHAYTLTIRDPLPAYAAREPAAGGTFGTWVLGGISGVTGTGCHVAGTAGSNTNVSLQAPAKVCVMMLPPAEGQFRLRATVSGPHLANESTWESGPFTAASGGPDAPTSILPVILQADAKPGASRATVRYQVERAEGEAWVPAGEGAIELPFTITASLVPIGKAPAGIVWLAQGPILLLAVGGIAYLALKERKPKIQPRSQAMRAEMAERTSKRRAGGSAETMLEPPSAEAVEQQRQEVKEAAWDKKRKILEAKREDILKSIRLAEERKARGEITDHVFNGIKERKERQLEQVDSEMEQLR